MYNTYVEQNYGETNAIHDENYFKDFLTKAGCNFLTTAKPVDKFILDNQKLKKIFGNNSETVETILIPILINHLQKDIIIDSFQDNERREWRRSLPLDIRKYYEDKNKIRGNNVTCVLGAISLLPEQTEDLEIKKEFEKDYTDLVIDPKNPQKRFEYSDLTIDQKIEFAGKLDNAALKILEMIS